MDLEILELRSLRGCLVAKFKNKFPVLKKQKVMGPSKKKKKHLVSPGVFTKQNLKMLTQVAEYKQQKPKHLLGVFIFHFIVERQQQRLWPSAMDFFSIVGRFGWPLEEAEGIILRWNSDLVWWLKLAGFPFFLLFLPMGVYCWADGWSWRSWVWVDGHWLWVALILLGVAQLWWFLLFFFWGLENT